MYTQAHIIKNTCLLTLATFGGVVAQLFGGWDAMLKTLVICMAVDYVTGVIVAAMGKSQKSASGRITSRAAVEGIVRKGIVLLIVLVVTQLENATGTSFVRASVIVFFLGTEGLSIIENAGLLGVPIPSALAKWFEVLRDKGDKNDPRD